MKQIVRRRVRLLVLQARLSDETRRISQAAALPFAAMFAIVWIQLALMARDGDGLSLAAVFPVIWGAILVAGVATVIHYWLNRPL